MDVVFLDSNVLFSAAWRRDSGLRRLWKLPGARLITSAYAVEEARRNLPTPHQQADLSRLLESVAVVPGQPQGSALPAGWRLPDKDKPILSAAIAARATHLVTGDLTHFRPYYGRTAQGVTVVTPAEYLRRRWPRDLTR